MATRLVALLPMRHASMRVPGKNYRPFAGRPLYHHILRGLLACPQIDQGVIDTDRVPGVIEMMLARSAIACGCVTESGMRTRAGRSHAQSVPRTQQRVLHPSRAARERRE